MSSWPMKYLSLVAYFAFGLLKKINFIYIQLTKLKF